MVVPFDAGTLRNPQHEFQGPVVHRLQIPRKHRGSHKVPLVQGAEEAEEAKEAEGAEEAEEAEEAEQAEQAEEAEEDERHRGR